MACGLSAFSSFATGPDWRLRPILALGALGRGGRAAGHEDRLRLREHLYLQALEPNSGRVWLLLL
ncbi:Hypothetical predicted protein [Marmota monax]|uniref:Uncharacterized protein n=1 Tax=Marmota monax TaxID=9995 RepID=A0A5E4D0X5_MARMO|nr:Hypothetical predicted protein [Marmota monax]